MKLCGHMDTLILEKVNTMDELTKPELYETLSVDSNANADADERDNAQEEPVEPFTLEEMMQLISMNATHDPVLAEYWGDDSDDDLIANP